ncbi:hypothetical protein GCM10011391_19840 [Pullulanibacillus camelliae]|uniref:Cytosolic protein n=1 Tax=Pullulanibacillus camelliae TaxID=1707096 RepID=A0A8J2YH63_9BACL|nr:YlbD family protein [Pullulanibacillus camelliae]GGE41114.1 hypothetical protein GCM10011391_19840 [Pullulanibacillus camelliae]
MVGKKSESVNAFKAFVKKHPELIKAVREQKRSWQDIFDEYVLFGEHHEVWKQYGITTEDEPRKKPKGANEIMRVLDFISNIDANEMQEHLNSFNGVLTNIQDLIVQFQPQSSQTEQQAYPFYNMTNGGQNTNNAFNPSPYFRRD